MVDRGRRRRAVSDKGGMTKDGTTHLPQNVLVERGPAGYTNGVEKAKAILAGRGPKDSLAVGLLL
jgi:hypothetical protein